MPIPKKLRWPLYIVTSLVALIVGFYLFVRWSGARAWEMAAADYTAAGESLDFDDFVPAPIPDSQNYAAIPSLFGITDPGDEADAIREALSLDLITGGYGDSPFFGNAFASGERPDLHAWAKFLAQGKTNPDATSAEPTPIESGSKDAIDAPKSDSSKATREDATAILSALDAQFAVLFSQSDQAASLPGARWLPPVTDSYNRKNPILTTTNHFTAAVGFGRILTLRTIAAIHAGDPSAAKASLLAILHLAPAEKPFATALIPFLVSDLQHLASFTALWEGLAERTFDEETLATLQKKFAAIDSLSDFADAMRMEIISMSQTVKALKDGEFNDEETGLGVSLTFYPSGWIDHARAAILREIHETVIVPVEKRDLVLLRTRQAELNDWLTEVQKGWLSSIRWRLVALMLPVYERVTTNVAYTQAVANQAQTACALERHFLRHGSYPDSLEALVPEFLKDVPEDPIDRNPLRYRRTDDGGRYRLYSMGWNQRDDGGIPAWTQSEQRTFDKNEADWVWSFRDLRPKP